MRNTSFSLPTLMSVRHEIERYVPHTPFCFTALSSVCMGEFEGKHHCALRNCTHLGEICRGLCGLASNRVEAAPRMAAVALQRSHSALGTTFRRMARRKGYRVAVFATARELAQFVYRMLRWGQDYVDIGEQAYELQFRQVRIVGIKRAAESLGYELVPQTPAPM